MLDRTSTTEMARLLYAATPLYLDYETRSSVDLKKCGVHLYAHPLVTQVICAAYAVGDGPVQLWRPGMPVPKEFIAQVKNGGPIVAHNATFERLITQHIMHPEHGWPLPLYTKERTQWQCTMARAYAMALPGSLDMATFAIGFPDSKDKAGHKLMRKMTKPQGYDDEGAPTWDEDATHMEQLGRYCVTDIEAERKLNGRVNYLRDTEYRLWLLDQHINDRGVCIDRDLCVLAQHIVSTEMKLLNEKIRRDTSQQVKSVNSVQQIIRFCKKAGVKHIIDDGVDDGAPKKTREITSLRSEDVDSLLAQVEDMDRYDEAVKAMLEVRQEASKVSVRKIQALLDGRNVEDNRVRGLLQYHAASTGRWAGRRFQPQNIKRPTLPDQDKLIGVVEQMRTQLQHYRAEIKRQTGASVLEVISNILRGMIVAERGKMLYAADYSSIEGRGLAWLVGEEWKLNAYRAFDAGEGPDIYKLAYSKAFGVPVEDIGDKDDRRQIGKVCELALGYQGAVGAFQSMASAYRVKVSDAQANAIKIAWRAQHPRTVEFWRDIERAAIEAVSYPGKPVTCGRLQFCVGGSFLYMRLPSGRTLSYPYPRIMELPTPFGWDKLTLTYRSVTNITNNRKVVEDANNVNGWARIKTYGGMLTENAVQALARDVMAEAMLRVEAAGFPIVLTVHDEIVAETSERTVKEYQQLMEQVPDWAEGFPIVTKAWAGVRYRKD